jgi:hypothetical protein
MLERVPISEVIGSVRQSGLSLEDADKAVERMIRDGIMFMKETDKGPSF